MLLVARLESCEVTLRPGRKMWSPQLVQLNGKRSLTRVKCPNLNGFVHTVGPKSVDFPFWTENSFCCRAKSWSLTSVCHWGLARDSSVTLGVFTNGSEDPEIGVDLWVHQMICESCMLGNLLLDSFSCLDIKLHKNLLLWHWGAKVYFVLQIEKLPCFS